MDAGGGHVVDVEEFTHRRAAAPNGDRLIAALSGLMEAAHQSRDDVAVLGMEIVARTIKIGRHDASIVSSELAVVAFTQFDPGDLGDGIRFICSFERAGQKRLFLHRLVGELWVDAGRAQKEKVLNIIAMRCMNDIRLNHQIFIDEVGWIDIIGVDPPDAGGREIDLVDTRGFEKSCHRGLINKVEIVPPPG